MVMEWFIGTNEKPQTERMIKEYKQSKLNFGILQEGKLKDIINQCGLVYETPEWEFPKGRRSSHETNMKCAIREFEEETDVSKNEYTLLDNVSPLTEEFIGSNGVRYKHIIFAFYKDPEIYPSTTYKICQFSEDRCFNGYQLMMF